MAENLANDGDHIVMTGSVDANTGDERAVLFDKNGNSREVLVSSGSGPGQDFRTEPCDELSDMPNVVAHVRTGTGHRGPATVNCTAFRDQIVKMFGEHRLDPSRRDERD